MSTGTKMKVLKSNVPITLGGITYPCDIILGLYASTKQPAIILVDTAANRESFGETVTVASVAVDPSYLTGMPNTYFAGKNWSENEGLWEQLEPLCYGDTPAPLFLRTSKRLTLGFCVGVPVYDLGPDAAEVFQAFFPAEGA